SRLPALPSLALNPHHHRHVMTGGTLALAQPVEGLAFHVSEACADGLPLVAWPSGRFGGARRGQRDQDAQDHRQRRHTHEAPFDLATRGSRALRLPFVWWRPPRVMATRPW